MVVLQRLRFIQAIIRVVTILDSGSQVDIYNYHKGNISPPQSSHLYFYTFIASKTTVDWNRGNPFTVDTICMNLQFHWSYFLLNVTLLQSHVMTYDLQTTTAYWWCENFEEGHEYLRPSVQARSRLLQCSGFPVVAGRQVATFAQSTCERAASSELLVALHRKH